MKDLLKAMGIGPGVTVREENVQYRFLARQLHPDKHGSDVAGMKSEEVFEIFKLVNNT